MDEALFEREMKRAVEAVVLVAHEPVPPELLAQLLEQPVVLVEAWCKDLAEQYGRDRRGYELARVAGGYRYQTVGELAPYVERFLLHDQRARLSAAALETLAIVAYRQPISRAQITSIRGVDPDAVLRTLTARGYVAQVGRRQRAGPGHPVRHHRAVPRATGARPHRGPAAARPVHPRRRRRGGTRGRSRH